MVVEDEPDGDHSLQMNGKMLPNESIAVAKCLPRR
jgi:hypothetical protein